MYLIVRAVDTTDTKILKPDLKFWALGDIGYEPLPRISILEFEEGSILHGFEDDD